MAAAIILLALPDLTELLTTEGTRLRNAYTALQVLAGPVLLLGMAEIVLLISIKRTDAR